MDLKIYGMKELCEHRGFMRILHKIKTNCSRLILPVVIILGICIAQSCTDKKSSSAVLIKNGKPKMTVLIDNKLLPLDQPQVVINRTERGDETLDDLSEQRRAILEFTKYIKLISGADLQIEAAKEGDSGCYIGLGSSFPWLNTDVSHLGYEGFIIRPDGKNIYLLADKPLGVRHAVMTFLMNQGCRWFFPGKVWEEVPQKATIEAGYELEQIPSFPMGRTMWYGYGTFPEPAKDQAEWNFHNRMGSPMPVSIGHTWYGIDPEKDFASHPEWFALVDGSRKPSKVCYSNPDVIQRMISYAMEQAAGGATTVSLSPADGLGYCECDLCFATARGGEIKEEMGTFFATRPDGQLICTVSETLFNAVNEFAGAVGRKYPDVMLGCYGYSSYSQPPSFKLEPNVFIQTTTHYRRTHLTLEEQLNLWGKRADQVGIRGYWSVYQWDWDNPFVGKFIPELIQKDLQLYNKHNGKAFNTEASNNWGARGLSYYLGSQLLWDVNTDTRSVIKDFYEKAFGPAARVMERYYMLWYGPGVSAFEDESDKGAKSKENKIGLNEIADYDPKSTSATKENLAEAFKYLDEASELVSGQSGFEQRIDQLRMYLCYLVFREKVQKAAESGDNTAIAEAIKNETEFGARLTKTNMIHSMPLLGKAFMRLFKDYEDILKDIPESQVMFEGWRSPGDPPSPGELEQLWADSKKYLGI
ncbi:MAG: DUF4838 domain-containing protein [Prolixibacteraceae bacterium]|nr:DUF4838 domain-containing protein [Prolixibacteraceae bacterium]